MKVTVLAENTSCRQDCGCEHGLSLYVDTGCCRILFDTGQTDLFAENARKLGVDLGEVDIAVLSHGHYDHGGGIGRFLKLNGRAKVYVSRYAFGDYYSEKYIGLDKRLSANERLIFTGDDALTVGCLRLIPWGTSECSYPSFSGGLSKVENGIMLPDDFRHEQYMMIDQNGRRVLFSGCSHKGILNIMERFQPDVMVGGFHFMKLSTDGEGREQLLHCARQLSEYTTEYYTCHCTGTEQYDVLSSVIGDRLHYVSSGMMIEI